jgi:hypothetical protein
MFHNATLVSLASFTHLSRGNLRYQLRLWRIRRVTKKERGAVTQRRRRAAQLGGNCKRAIRKGIVARWESRLPWPTRRRGGLVAPSRAPKKEGGRRRPGLASGRRRGPVAASPQTSEYSKGSRVHRSPVCLAGPPQGGAMRCANRGKNARLASIQPSKWLLCVLHRALPYYEAHATDIPGDAHPAAPASRTSSLAPAVSALPGRSTGPLRDRVNARAARA